MFLKTEEINENSKSLFIFNKYHLYIDIFKNKLNSFEIEVFSSPKLPENFFKYKYIIIFANISEAEKIIEKKELLNANKKTKILIIFFNDKENFIKIGKKISHEQLHQIKLINLDVNELNDEIIEKVFWFFLSSSKEISLNLDKNIRHVDLVKKNNFRFIKKIKIKNIWKKIIAFVFFLEFIFIIPLVISGVLLFKSSQYLIRFDIKNSENYLYYSTPFLSLTKKTYEYSRPVLSIFYLALIPDNLISLEENGYQLIQNGLDVTKNTQNIIEGILKKNKNKNEEENLIIRLDKLDFQINEIQKRISAIKQLINYDLPFFEKTRNNINNAEQAISQIKKFYEYRKEMLGENKEKKYLLLFANNMELRPGGGFLGSFGVLKFYKNTLTDLKIYDIYDADGQLKAHIEPPAAIRKYLNQPHWFLRDSNFSPDFSENIIKAEFFLEKEMNFKEFDGTILFTTSAINYILEAYGDIYLPDFNEHINKNNFYIKTQTQVEKNFFPGSIQKKSFLSSLVRNLMINLSSVSYKELIFSIKKSFEEKQIVINSKNTDLQSTIESYGWSGKMVIPKCASQTGNCLVDALMPVDANLGVNKSNFFLSRMISQKINIKETGEIENQLSILFKNDSPMTVFPGGIYKNYFQVFIPANSKIKKITKDGVLINDYEKNISGFYDNLSFYFEIQPKKTAEIKIEYSLENVIQKGKGAYQLIVQKQIGSANNDLILEFKFPNNIQIINQNFSALAKGTSLVYNTNLSTDKIFFIELLKE